MLVLYVCLTNKDKWSTIFWRVVVHVAVYYTNYMVKVAVLWLDKSVDMVDNFCVFHLDALVIYFKKSLKM